MKFWIDLPKQRRLRIWIRKPWFSTLSLKNGLILLKIETDEGLTITFFNLITNIYFNCVISKKRNITTMWYNQEQSIIGFKKE